MPTVEPGVFMRYDAEEPIAPLLVDVSRSGREYPHDFRSPLPFSALHDNISMYVEELFGQAPSLGATLLYACFPNTYIDTNRSVLDIDPELVDGDWPVPLDPAVSKRGLGLIKRVSRYGDPMQERKLTVEEIQHRIDTYHVPYHDELSRALTELHEQFGQVLHLTCHCMSAVGMPTHPDAGQERADFCIGDSNGTTARPEPVEFLVEALRAEGYSVTVNTPYAGGELMTRHADPAGGIDSIMIEVNKRLFMDIETFKKTSGFEGVETTCTSLLKQAASFARDRVGS